MALQDFISDNKDNANLRNLLIATIVLIVVILGLITYFFFGEERVYDNSEFDNIGTPIAATAENPQVNPQDSTQSAALQGTQTTANTQKAAKPKPAAKQAQQPRFKPNAATKLQYVIKPLNAKVAVCDNMRNGKWKIPVACEDRMLESIQKLIDTNKEIIALEISGVVDNNPYAGPSAELKQEGLASFRAREAIGVVSRAYSSVAVFEGLSLQAHNKRGFEVKAYYLQK